MAPAASSTSTVNTAAKRKKTKTFTGCGTCRSRKIKCDLGKPSCQRCERSGLQCAGYQIVLCWSKPVKFDKYGSQVREEGNSEDTDAQPEGFQRRNIEFVKYDREYETYEEMDRDLGMLHTPNYSLIEHNQTWIQGQFGVFEGLRTVPVHLMRKRRKLAKSKYATQARELAIAMAKEKSQSKAQSPSVSSQRSGSLQQQQTFSEASTPQVNPNLLDPKINHEWLSEELRFDALLSATAVTSTDHNSVFFDFLYPYNTDGGPQHQPSTHSANFETNSLELFPYDREVFNALRPHSFNNENTPATLSAGEGLGVAESATADSEIEANQDEEADRVRENTKNLSFNAKQEIVISTAESKMPDNAMKIINTPVFPSLSAKLAIPTKGLQVSSLTRFLLDHYYENVADMMTVIPFVQNPWKTIYFPRAVKALGDLCAIGNTSDSRLSLLNALLAVSCFSLQSRFPKGSTEMKFFLNLGIEFRLQASSFLKKIFSKGNISELFNDKTEKYKDVLVANLSMNTIDVVWGTMADCPYYLSICEEIISQRMDERPHLSNKAKILHRIFSFLKLIQDSTNFNILSSIDVDEKNKFWNKLLESRNNGKTTEFYENVDQDGVIEIGFVNKGSFKGEHNPHFIDEVTCKPKETKDILMTDALYGLPNSLILLFSETVKLLKLKFFFESVTKTPEINAEIMKFDALVEAFEKKLINWKTEWKLTKFNNNVFISRLHEAIDHHAVSFYNGLIIYYFTLLRPLPITFLQSYAQATITRLEELHILNTTPTIPTQLSNIMAGAVPPTAATVNSDTSDETSSPGSDMPVLPLMWQGFIAGCIAIDPALQERFRKWASNLAHEGVGSYWGARQMMFEVWRRRKNDEVNDDWVNVHKDWQMNIMLS